MELKNIECTKDSIVVKSKDGLLKILAWGDDTVRVIASPQINYNESNHNGYSGLRTNTKTVSAKIEQSVNYVKLKNGRLTVKYDGNKLVFYNDKELILEEFLRTQSNVRRTVGVDDHIPIPNQSTSSLKIRPRNFKYRGDNSYKVVQLFEADKTERIYGLGGYQEEGLDKNGGSYELMHRNSQTSIPFYISSKNYGFIWNNSSVGNVDFSFNQIKWVANNTDAIDYIVTIADNPKNVLANYMKMTGYPPMINSNLLGLWQSKLRYQTLDELKAVYNGYKNRGIQLSVLVIDYYHWTADGDFQFDDDYWNGIKEFSKLLKEDGCQLMVSLWPTVSKDSLNYEEYQNLQMMLRGVDGEGKIFNGFELLDFFNPMTKTKIRQLLSKNYRSKGINLFWADQAEPEMDVYQHEKYLSYKGNLGKYANEYPLQYIETVQKDSSDNAAEGLPLLVRSAWLGAQKHGALVWTGDIESSFKSLRRQIYNAISFGLSGISWWTSDIGGFHSGDSNTAEFKELLIRWFQFAVFSPILRMHGDRQPHTPRIGNSGGGVRTSGGPNEIWSFGDEVEKILISQIKLREKLKPYLKLVFEESSKTGQAIIRALFLEYPDDNKTWNDSTNYMLGGSLLVCPVTNYNQNKMEIYLPKGSNWLSVEDGREFSGGQTIEVELCLESIPVFIRNDSQCFSLLCNVFNL